MDLFTCPKHQGLKLTPEGCGKSYAKMKRLSARKDIHYSDVSFFNMHKPCIDCKIGEENMSKVQKEQKTCPCGKVFSKREGESWVAWQRRKWCPEHSKMTPYKRDKLFGKKETAPAAVSESKSKTTPTPDKIKKPAEKKNTTHTCAGPCGRTLELTAKNFQRDASKDNGFSSVCKKCRNKQERARRAREQMRMTLDFSDSADLFERVTAWAKKNRRTPDQQILFALGEGWLGGLEKSA